MDKKLACLLYGNNKHYIDHLAPLSYFFQIPLITNDVEVEELVQKFYPSVTCNWVDTQDLSLYLQDFAAIISCIATACIQALLGYTLKKRAPITIFCPHGNSDKKNLYMLRKEKYLLIYGKQMQQRLPRSKNKQYIAFLGDYRKRYYEKKRIFYQSIAKKHLPQNFAKKPFFFYAPTWEDYENNFSFKTMQRLAAKFPSSSSLLVKLHPNTWLEKEAHILRCSTQYPQAFFLDNIPIVYPFLDLSSGYIGDASSVGYDGLLLEKTLFFYTKKQKNALYRFGEKIHLRNLNKTLSEKRSVFCPKKQEFSNYVFEKKVCLPTVYKSLMQNL